MLKHLMCFLFIARVLIPMQKIVYDNVDKVETQGFYYVLYLTTGKKVFVPTLFTIIEEK